MLYEIIIKKLLNFIEIFTIIANNFILLLILRRILNILQSTTNFVRENE